MLIPLDAGPTPAIPRKKLKLIIHSSDQARLSFLAETLEEAVDRLVSRLENNDAESEDGTEDENEATVIPITAAQRRLRGIGVRNRETTKFTEFEARTLDSSSGSFETRTFRMSHRITVSFSMF